MGNLHSLIKNIRRRRALSLCLTLGLAGSLAGCADQDTYFTPQASGTLNSTAQILGDLTFLFK